MPTRNLIESFHVQSIFVKIATITLLRYEIIIYLIAIVPWFYCVF